MLAEVLVVAELLGLHTSNNLLGIGDEFVKLLVTPHIELLKPASEEVGI